MSRLKLFIALLLLAGAAACKRTEHPPPANVVPAGHFFGTLRLSVDDQDLDKEVYFYVETTFQGANGYSTEVSLDEGEYRATAATPVNDEAAAFYVVTKRVQITAGKTSDVRFNLPDEEPPPEEPEDSSNKLEYITRGCNSGSGTEFVDRSRTVRGDVASRLSSAQSDPLYTYLSATFYSLQSQPPAAGRITVQNVPVKDLDSGSITDMTMELVPEQLRHLDEWLESQKYDFESMENDTQGAANELASIIQEAENCQDQSLLNASAIEKSYVDNLLAQVKSFRQQFQTTMTGIVKAVEDAGRHRVIIRRPRDQARQLTS
jgi:hypothetical protein